MAAGADLVEIFVERNDQLAVLAEQERITSVSPAMGCGAGIRVFKGHRDGFVATNDISGPALMTGLEQALSMLGLCRSTQVGAWQGLAEFRDYGRGKEQWLKGCPGVSDSAERLREATTALDRHGRHLQSRRASYARDWQEVLVAASDGTFARDLRLHQTTGITLLAADGDHRATIGRRDGRADDPDFLANWPVEDVAVSACRSAGKMLYADVVAAGDYPVVLANRFGGVIFHEACGPFAGDHPSGAGLHPLCRQARPNHCPSFSHRH